ncbi:hypothetical protein SAMN07250955_103347 [Arboricoccus pini]|uniref:Uncharacterized protein n=1 Tax=Arboricoccus pini TaxID=1963835 RepID=A0A212QVA2_9PROT|nr:hypothetical protein [Arboricoccus pini]SNB63504.1 hypothetical protein SAMN07250955_103347 [Arboricoccus pini]
MPFADDRLFPLVALLCALCWLLTQSGWLSRRASRFLLRVAILLLVTGIAVAIVKALAMGLS